MEKKREAFLGHVIATLAMLTSLGLSCMGAVDPSLGAAQILFIILAVLTEPSKLVFNRVIWKTVAATKTQRFMALLAYGLCVAVSIGLTHLLVHRTVEAAIAEEDRQLAQEGRVVADAKAVLGTHEAKLRTLEGEIRGVEGDIEAARSEAVPVPRTEAMVRAILAGKTNKTERDLAYRDLELIARNGQVDAKVTRLQEKHAQLKKDLEKSRAERPESFANVRPNDSVRNVSNVRNVRDKILVLSILLAFVLEILISGGVWADAVTNSKRLPKEPPKTPERPNVRPPNDANDVISANAVAFEAALRKEWKARRGKDGWLEGTQQGWATQSGVSSGYVYRQLDRMVGQGLIEKRAQSKKTWVRFVEKPKLKLVGGN